MTKRPFAFGARRPVTARTQRGATLIIGLIMLVLITLIVVNAFTLSSTNLKSVGNMQVREEAIAAANLAIEHVIFGSSFTEVPVAQSINVDINKDGINDYVVAIAAPTCVRALVAANAVQSDTELGAVMSAAVAWNTEWDINATVTDAASGASVRVRQGVRVLLSDDDKTNVCL